MPVFNPRACPNCENELRPPYSQYRTAAKHRLWWPLLVAGTVTTILGGFFLFDQAWRIVWPMTQNMLRRERGAILFGAVLVLLPLISLYAKFWWSILHSLPRTFVAKCEECEWRGPCQVRETMIESIKE